MNERTRIIDLADAALTHIAASDWMNASEQQRRAEFVEYLRDRVLERIASGRSTDCDEYQALRLEGQSSTAARAIAKVTDGSQPMDYAGALMVARCAA